ncbi:MAG: hypothetical protein HY226_04885 [Candidatus Vogelbacteria bacterium]|nr:hypothetical protein [Candidatus Vogelbacteria bacterium]
MKFLDKDFLKTALQFILIVFFGVAIVSFVSGIKTDRDATAGVVVR